MKAAARMGVLADTLADAAEKAFGRSFIEERNARVDELVAPGATPRSVQAIRGHVTRELIRELRPMVKPTPKKRGRKGN